MLCLARDLLCKVRLSKSFNRAVSSRWSCWRNYAANKLNFASAEIPSKAKFVPCGSASFPQVCIPTSDEHVFGSRYYPVIYKALHIRGSKALEAGVNVENLTLGMEEALEKVLGYFMHARRMVHSLDEIAQVATTVANGETELVNFIARGMQEVGKDALCFIAKNKKANNEVEFVNALDLSNWHFCSTSIIPKRGKTFLLESPFILVIVNKILSKNMVQAIEQAMRPTNHIQPRPLLIFAEDVEKGVDESLMLDGSCHQKKLCIIRPLGDIFGSSVSWSWTGVMEDLAILTGGQVLNGESDLNFIPQMLGSCKKVRVSEGKMLIYGASGDRNVIEERRKQVKYAVMSDNTSSLVTRLQFLSQAVRFKVGKASNRDRFIKVACATNVAMKLGILPGGGVALFNASKELNKLNFTSSDAMLGVQLLRNALRMPVYCIASSSGFDGSVAVEKLLDQENPNLGYDPVTGEYMDMIKSGIIDRTDFLSSEIELAIRHFYTFVLRVGVNVWELL